MADPDDFENATPQDQPVAAGSSSGAAPTVTCTGCGLPLLRRGPKGECLRCLMDFAFPSEDEESPVKTSSGAKPSGKTVWRYGHFEIAIGEDGHPVELGAGAMATTYRATDSVLHSAVALKVINQTVAEHPSARARFLREARAAAKLHHPNVASVSHYGEQNGEYYYVMELVEGETLEARVRRVGPLPPALALEIGVQVARALAAAEACGVVHRDLKPSNIMLTTPQGEKMDGGASTVVKVIDWGLAKAASAESALGTDHTHGGFVGTPAFASPEQFSRADDRRIDHRSDIYSLGVTLWYLLCGRTPFSGTTLGEIRARQMEQPIPLAQLATARVPARIVALLKSMMAVNPAARPQSARELLDALRACQEHFPVEGMSRNSRRSQRRRWAFVGLMLIACLSIALAAGWYYRQVPSAAGSNAIAVLPFENLSPDPSEKFFARGVRDAIASGLARITHLTVVGPDSVKAYPPGNRDLPAIGQALGVSHLLEGSVQRQGEQVHIHVRLVDTRNSARTWTAQYDRPMTDVFAIDSEVTRAVAERLRVTPSRAEIADINQPPTHNLAAYDLYLRSQEGVSLASSATEMRRVAQHEVDLLDQAVKLDPDFMQAFCALARAHDNIFRFSDGATAEERAIDHRTLADVALQKARRLQPDAGELHLAQAAHFLNVDRNREQARVELDLARRALPNNADVERYTGQISRLEGRWNDAVRAFERAVLLEPRDPGRRADLAITYSYLRDYANFDRTVAAMIELTPTSEIAELPLFRAEGAIDERADLAPLRVALAGLQDANDPGSYLRDNYGLLLALFENSSSEIGHRLAASHRDRFLWSHFAYPKAWFQALAARMRKDADAAQAAFIAARADVEKTVLADARDERNLLLLAMIDAGLGRNEDAVDEAQRACAMEPADQEALNGPSDRCCLAVVYAWTNHSDLALKELNQLVGQPAGDNMPNQPTYGDLKLNPLWEPLRTDPRFAALVERLAPAAKH